MHTELNTFQFFQRDALASFQQKLKNANQKKVTVLHIGDSHVQADLFTGEVRDQLQMALGYGGRGMVFPYSTARTHAAIDYTTAHTGKWLYAKNVEQYPELPLGVSGASSRTYDSSASFTLSFRGTIKPSFTRLVVFCKRDEKSYGLKVIVHGDTLLVDTYSDKNDASVIIDLPAASDIIKFQVAKTHPEQSEFEIYGVSIENPEDKGILYHSVGINGAGHFSLLRQSLMEQQLKQIKPDLIVLDVGANDFYRLGMNRTEFEGNLNRLISLFKSQAPEANILLSCSQDIYRGGYSIPDCEYFADVIRQTAEKQGVAFYDWYWIAGGRYSMMQWYRSALAKFDLVHLSNSGYKLKGQLIAEAFHKTFDWYNDHDSLTQLIYAVDSLKAPKPDTSKTTPVYQYKWINHRVLRGQTIFGIAAYYGVTAYQIRTWNRLRNNYLWIGQILKIYAPIKVSSSPNTPTPTPTPPQQTPPVRNAPNKPPAAKPKAVYHKVRSGETLFGIAKKYGTTTNAIMKLNGLKTYTIYPGQTLRVK